MSTCLGPASDLVTVLTGVISVSNPECGRILHISADVPDPLQPAKTKAISNLVNLTADDFEHHVYSLNRVGHTHGIAQMSFGSDWRAIAYGAPPRGIFLKTYLDRVASWILQDVRERGLRVDCVHAHKLSIDALPGAAVARALGVPLVVSSQGNTDIKVIRARRDLRRHWRAIWQEAAVVFPFAPWTTTALEGMLGPRDGTVIELPCPTDMDRVMPPRPAENVFRAAFHLRDYRNKNAIGLVRASAIAAREVPDIRLEILGGGDPAAFVALEAVIQREAPAHARLRGPVPHDRIQAEMNAACGFVMVSYRESFGMVFTEALLGGCPVIHGAGNGIAGYFPASPATAAVPPGDTKALAAALVSGVRRQEEIKTELRRLQKSGALSRLTRASIRATYVAAIRTVIAGTPSFDDDRAS